MITGIYIGREKLDLFEDENIHIVSSISRIEDITKIFTDTSKSFTVPASDNNNRIFKHWYNAIINNSFDARKKVQGLIELGGLDYKFGLFRLEKVVLKSNIPSAYTITYFGNLVALKDLLGDDELTDLDLSAYDFPYDYEAVRDRLGQANTGKEVLFTLSSKKHYFYDSVNDLTTSNNIHFNGNGVENGFLWSDAIGSIKAIRIIEAIESKYGIEFSRDFFGLNEFSNLYFMLSSGADVSFSEEVPIVNTNDPTVVGNVLLAGSETGTLQIRYSLNAIGSSESIPYTVIVKNNGVEIYRRDLIGDNFDSLSQAGFPVFDRITFEVESLSKLNYDFSIERIDSGSLYDSNTPPRFLVTPTYEVYKKLPKMKDIDFLSGLFKTYRLIAIVNTDGTIYVDSYANYMRKGKVWSGFEKQIDFSKIDVARGVLNNEINYKFKDSKGVLGVAFKDNESVEYGNLEHRVLDDNDQLVDGTSLDFEVAFGTEVYTKLLDRAGVDETGIQFLGMYNEDLNAVDIEPHLHFINLEFAPNGFKMYRDDGTTFNYIGTVNAISHTLGFISPVSSTVFGEEFNEWDGSLISNTIFSNHHQSYIDAVFNEKTRSFTYTAKNVPLEVLNKIELNDVLEIREEYYRIDSYDINITTNEIVFKLINAINLDLTPQYSMSLDRIDITLDSIEVTLDQI